MSIGVVVKWKHGLVHKTNLYIQLKNGSVYRFNSMMPTNKQREYMDRVQRNGGRISLKQWTKVNLQDRKQAMHVTKKGALQARLPI